MPRYLFLILALALLPAAAIAHHVAHTSRPAVAHHRHPHHVLPNVAAIAPTVPTPAPVTAPSIAAVKAPKPAHFRTCIALGDSIAVRAAQVTGCRKIAKVGIPSRAIRRSFSTLGPAEIIVSAGSNDPKNRALGANMDSILSRLLGNVLVLLPYDRHAAAVDLAAAKRHGADALDLKTLHTSDGLHPDYGPLKRALSRQLG